MTENKKKPKQHSSNQINHVAEKRSQFFPLLLLDLFVTSLLQ